MTIRFYPSNIIAATSVLCILSLSPVPCVQSWSPKSLYTRHLQVASSRLSKTLLWQGSSNNNNNHHGNDFCHGTSSPLDPSSRASFLATTASLLFPMTFAAHAAATSASAIAPCTKAPNNGPTNCVSTSSVRQVELSAPVWSYPSYLPVELVQQRLQDAIVADRQCHISTTVLPSTTTSDTSTTNRIVAVAQRPPFAQDQFEFVINPVDHVVQYRGVQIQGPTNVSDFGAIRQRLDGIRSRAGIFSINSSDAAYNTQQEGPLGQLKAFYGLQSGSGFESVLQNLDE
jgi:uncharacterized protein (DUF1499 family)